MWQRPRNLLMGVSILVAAWVPAGSLPAAAESRVALVIGNGAYQHAPALANPLHDAADVGAALARLGFAVTRLEDADYAALRRGLLEFTRAAAAADIAVVFYAGHGIEVDQRNFLVPVDARLLSDRDVEFETVPLELVSRAVDGASGLRVVILDACRENPFAVSMQRAGATRAIGRGLARVEPSGATLVAYAAKEGTVAADGEGRNSPYSRALLTHLEEPGLEVGLMFRRVRDAVMAATGGRQEPFTYGSIPSRGAYLVDPPTPTTDDRPTAESPATDRLTAEQLAVERLEAERELLFWESVKDSDIAASLQAYLDRYPGGTYEVLARNLLQEMQMAVASAEAPAAAKLPPPSGDPDPEAVEAGLGLERSDRRRIQAGLAALGFDPGPADGLFGRGTRGAIGKWQAAQGGVVTGYLDAAAAKTLLAAAPEPEEPAEDLRLVAERAFWEEVSDSEDPADLEGYLAAYPGGAYAMLAQRRLDRLAALADDAAFADAQAAGTAAAFEEYVGRYPAGRHVAVARAEAERLRAALAPGRVFRDCSHCPEMVVVPPGSFMMGSPASEEGRFDDEGPVHQVTIAKPFAVGKYEVAFAEWDACVAAGGCVSYHPDNIEWPGGRLCSCPGMTQRRTLAGCRARRESGIGCRAKPSGNMRHGPARRVPSISGRQSPKTKPTSAGASSWRPGSIFGRLRAGRFQQIVSVCTTCTGMSGSGSRTAGTTAMPVPRPAGTPGPRATATNASSAAEAGSSVPATYAPPTGLASTPGGGASLRVSELPGRLPLESRLLFLGSPVGGAPCSNR